MIEVRTTTELVVTTEHKAGELARVLGVIAVAGMNVLGYYAYGREGKGVIHVVAEDPDEALRHLQQAGLAVTTEEVLLVAKLNHIGSEAGIARRLGAAGITILYAYATAVEDGRYLSVIKTMDNEAASAALSGGPAPSRGSGKSDASDESDTSDTSDTSDKGR